MTKGHPALNATGLGRTVDGRALWSDLSIQLRPGDRIALRGPSGSGKTLLMRTLVGLEPLEQGDIQAFGRSLAEWRKPDLRARVMYLPQRIVLPPGTVAQAIERPFGFAIHSDRTYRRGEVVEMLRAFGREERFLHLRTEDLSGGEEQIVSFTRAILLRPDVLLLDEPSASLDPEATGALEDRLMNWHAEAGRAFMITSHDPDQLDRLTDTTLDVGDAP